MKTFLKVLLAISLSIYSIISFIRLDLSIDDWGNSGRAIFLFFVLVFSAIVSIVIESDKLDK